MIDIQNQSDGRNVPLAKVGVKGLEYPIRVLDKVKKVQYTTAKADLYADLPRHFKGAHMSRFIEIFHRYRENLSMPRFLEMLETIREELEAESAFGSLAFPYFLEKRAPVSGLPGMMSYQCRYQGRVNILKAGGSGQPVAGSRIGTDRDGLNGSGLSPYSRRFTVAVSVPVATVCPCSKAISDRGAHNQRGIVSVELEAGPFFWIEDIIELVEKAASSPVYSLIKREDEKFITEHAYDNPKFVEDLVRDVYIGIKELNFFPRFSVEAENFESIHNHNAFAYAEFGGA
ncbi:MAG: GTP cyclohydrolase I FolE2 [Treponema sp.]|jgi:GTP cyclohydrolase I|nr:GTP cyclohydrolase I FolE2 [Treponema sp.]